MTSENQKEESLPLEVGDRTLNIEESVDNTSIIQGDRNTVRHVTVFIPITDGRIRGFAITQTEICKRN